jgi:NADH-quinone oxidoreductase subunit H
VMMSDIFGLVGLTGVAEFMLEFFGTTTYQMQLADLDVGLLFIFAMGGTSIFAAAMAGWASNNKWSLMGALRSSSQMISYEVFMGISILGLIVIYGTVNMNEIAQIQGDFYMWGIFLQPHMFFIFTVALMAENKRVPFDMAEAESELVAGYFTEYSAMKMGLFMMAEFIEIAVIGGILTTLFFGGYHLPGVHGAGDVVYWANHPELTPGNYIFGTVVPHAVVVVLRVGSFLGKLLFFCWAQILIRWTLPKFRYDQIMRLGWKFLLPISIVNLLGTAAVVLVLS